MFRLFFTPGWFNGYDLLFDSIGLVVALLIAAYSWRVYQLHQENRFKYFSLAFLLVSISFGFKIFTSGVLYYFPVRETVAQVLRPATGAGLKYSALFYRAGFFLQMASMLGAWLLIFLISQKSRARLTKFYEVSQIGLFTYLVLLISVVSNFEYVVFYLTSSVLLALIVLNYYKNYLTTGKVNALMVLTAFLFILAGNLFLVFVFMESSFYAVGELFMLVGFLLLLYTYRKVIQR
ncbi:MAG TPA: hypothetical protein VJA18_02445 [Candidatus Nanoarchaeia archaeon]|nr:hypothetical protein [Candidatus Nanoarchaeia archaeon]